VDAAAAAAEAPGEKERGIALIRDSARFRLPRVLRPAQADIRANYVITTHQPIFTLSPLVKNLSLF